MTPSAAVSFPAFVFIFLLTTFDHIPVATSMPCPSGACKHEKKAAIDYISNSNFSKIYHRKPRDEPGTLNATDVNIICGECEDGFVDPPPEEGSIDMCVPCLECSLMPDHPTCEESMNIILVIIVVVGVVVISISVVFAVVTQMDVKLQKGYKAIVSGKGKLDGGGEDKFKDLFVPQLVIIPNDEVHKIDMKAILSQKLEGPGQARRYSTSSASFKSASKLNTIEESDAEVTD